MFGVRPVARCSASSAVPSAAISSACWDRNAELDVVAPSQLAVGQRAPAGQRLDQRRLAGPVGADQGHVLAPLEPQLGVLEQLALARRDRRSLELQGDAPAARPRLELEPQRPAGARVLLQALHLGELLHPCLGLARARPGAEARHEPLHALDLGLLALDRATQRELARGALLAPGMPRAGEEARPPALELEHRRADRLQEPAIVRHQHDRGIGAGELLLEPLQRRDVEVVRRLVQQQQIGVAGQGARKRATRELAAGEGLQRPVEVVLGEPEPAHDGHRPPAPVISAGVLEPRLGGRVVVERRLIGASGRHRLLEPRELVLQLDEVGAAGEHIVAQGQAPFPRRALVVEGDPGALLQRQLARVDRRLPGEHPQQGGLARAVAARQRKPLAALDLERDAAQQGIPSHVLAQPGCDRHRHPSGW